MSASAWVVWESAEGIKPPSASTLSHVGFSPLPQPLHAVALHGYAKGRYAIKRSPFAGCWCSGSLNVPRPLAAPLRCCRLRRLLCVGIQHNGVLCKAHAPVKAPALRVRIRAFMSRALRVNTATSQRQRPSPSSSGSKTGLVFRRPSAFCCLVGCADLSCLLICCRFAFCLLSPPTRHVRLRGVALRCSLPAHLPRFPSAPKWLP